MPSVAIVIAVFWLTTGEPAFDYMPADQCAALQAMTKAMGGVQLETVDGRLEATAIDCLVLQEAKETTP